MHKAMSIGIVCSLLIAGLFAVMVGTGFEGPVGDARGYQTERSVIRIDGNDDFTEANGVVSGTGTEDDPYIISGWEIDGTDIGPCVTIRNSTKFFVVRNCVFHHDEFFSTPKTYLDYPDLMYFGVVLDNVENGVVDGNEFRNNMGFDIYVTEGFRVSVINNIIRSKNGETMIQFSYTMRSRIENNILDPEVSYDYLTNDWKGLPPTRYGIRFVYESMYNSVRYNTIRNMERWGITLHTYLNVGNEIGSNYVCYNRNGIQGSDDRTIITNNMICYNEKYGIESTRMNGGNILNNDISHNGKAGIFLPDEGSSLHMIAHNLISYNGEDGIYTEQGSIQIRNNSIRNNEGNGISGNCDEIYVMDNVILDNNLFGITLANHTVNNIKGGAHRISRNNFISNGETPQVFDNDNNTRIIFISNLTPPIIREINYWDSNFWSDHTSPDDDSDGEVDVPYLIPGEANSSDNRPRADPYDINIEGPTFHLTITTLDKPSVKAGTAYSVKYNAIDPDPTKVLTWNMVTNASWLSFSDEKVLEGTPGLINVGYYWVNVSVTDGTVSDFHFFKVHVYKDIDPITGPGENVTKPNNTVPNATEDENQPPRSATIMGPTGELYENETIEFSAFSFDPDLEENETLSFRWTISGIGVVGSSSNITLVLPAGTYALVLNVTDPEGASIEVQKSLIVRSRSGSEENDDEWWKGNGIFAVLILVNVILLVLIVAGLVIQRRRRIDKTVDIENIEEHGTEDGPMRKHRRPKPPVSPDIKRTGSKVLKGPGLQGEVEDMEPIMRNDLQAAMILHELNAGYRPSNFGPPSEEIIHELKRMKKDGRISRSTYRELRDVLERVASMEE